MEGFYTCFHEKVSIFLRSLAGNSLEEGWGTDRREASMI
jgi:hypothetical protein